jgi:hypothetical protein
MLSGFSWKSDYLHCQQSPEGLLYFKSSALTVDLPAVINAYIRQRAIPSARGSVTTPSPHRLLWKSRNFNRVSHRRRLSAET